jgi:MFS transporter, DHA3 family, multidrug efflux protein
MKVFYNLLGNNFISSLTNFTVWFAITYFSYLETQSVVSTSLISGIFLITTASTGVWFGSLVDRYDKRLLMIYSSVFSMFIYCIGFIIYTRAPVDSFKSISNPLLWILIVILLFGVIAGNIKNIAVTALIPVLVKKDELDKANGLTGTVFGISFLIVSVISGFLVGASGMYAVLILAIVFSGLSIIHLQFFRIPKNKNADDSQDTSVIEDESSKKIDIKGTLKIIRKVPGLLPLIVFTTFNNFLGGVFMSLMDAYGLSLVSVEVWGVIWGILSLAFIVGGIIISKRGLGKSPLKILFVANLIIWGISSFFTIQPSILLLSIGMFIYLAIAPFIEAAEHTIIQKVVPQNRLGRVFGFAQSVEQAASPLMAFAIGPIAQLVFIPFMTTGRGVELIGSWFGTGTGRGIALVFTIVGVLGFLVTLISMRTKYYRQLSSYYSTEEQT